jgi:hypothetical protein
MRLQATQEGLVPLKTWIKNALDQVIQVCMGEPNLEFVWVGHDAVDPLQQAQTLQILVSAGIKTREEARAELGLGGEKGAAGLGKFNPNHDEGGRFATADGAVATVGSPARNPKPQGVQVASLDNVAPDGTIDDSGGSVASAPGAGDDNAQVAQARPPLGTSKYSVDLRAEEAYWGGHAVRDHVGKSPDDLIAEQAANRVDTPVEGGIETEYRLSESSYPSWESANDYINRLLESHRGEVDLVASGQWDEQWIEERVGSPTGIEVIANEQGQLVVRDTYNAGVLIAHDPRVPRGYRVKTAYPTNDKNSYPLPGYSR